jgi:hypothetical protein
MNIVNLTPHTISIVRKDGETIQVAPTAPAARVQQQNVVVDEVFGIAVSAVQYGEVENLPPPQEGTIYVVSAVVAQQCTLRSDVYAPDTGPSAIRNEAGQITAVRGLVSTAWAARF